MNAFPAKLLAAIQRAPFAAALTAAACIFGAWKSFSQNAGEWDSPLAIVLLAVLSGADALLRLPDDAGPKRRYAIGWPLLGAALLLMLWSAVNASEPGKNCALLLGVCAGISFGHGGRSLKFFVLPLVVNFLLLPFLENITLVCSYPLRLISTVLTVSTLQLFGAKIGYQLTTIQLGDTQVAITDACSGVSQLGVFLFFAYIMVRRISGSGWMKLLWCALTLPVVIAANTIRLLLTVGLFYLLGERAFQNDIHITLGYIFVILALLLLAGCGRLLRAGWGEK